MRGATLTMAEHEPFDDGYIELVMGDITRQQVDAIVNAANSSLLPGGGVCGAIHRVAGPELAAACDRVGGCPTGQACITPGYRLPARYVIHAVGPIWRGGDHGEDELLASAYRRSIDLAHEHGLRSIAFPSISTGTFGFPLDRAARIAVRTLHDAATRYPDVATIRMVAFSEPTWEAFVRAMEEQID
jgi:O-acetyl-ADP-ribose deacetylase (regulator of RNase III)